MRTIFRSSLLILTLAVSVLVASAQQKNQPPPKATPTPAATTEGQDEQGGQVFVNEVRLPISVVDKKKQPVLGLTKDDFLIFEDKQPQQIVSFRDEKDSLPVYVGVLMDTSPSTVGKLKFEKDAAKDFIYTVMRLRKDKVAFVTFDHEIKLQQDFTDKLDDLSRAVDNVKKPGEKTSLYDAIWQFCNEKMRGVPGLRVLVVITDGADTYSRADLSDAIDIAQRTETTVFAISTKAGFTGTVPGVEAGTALDASDRELEKLCAETGGAVFFTGDITELERSFTKISKELRTEYVLTYRPTNDHYDGSFRTIEVRLKNKRDGVKLRTRRGYTAIRD
ncbi:MAG: VWA domain-containing protein, partial [Acidobacteria bacterium]|nr:VWA domain-containing protein [Acidobacteriota bacterium]